MRAVVCYEGIFDVLGLETETLNEFAIRNGFHLATVETEPGELAFRFEEHEGLFDLHLGDLKIAEGQPLRVTLEVMRSRIHSIVVASRPKLTFIRANTLMGEGGRGFLVAGPSLTGKTRLSLAMMALGAKPFSKHYAVINDAGEVLPYPQPLAPASGVKLEGILLAPYHPGSEWQVRTATPGEMALSLVPLVEAQEEDLGAALARLASLTTQTRERWVGHRGEAENAARALLEMSEFKPEYSEN